MNTIPIIFILFISTTIAYKPFYEQVNCSMYNTGCRQCVRYIENYQEYRRGCSWCQQENYFESYCFNPNTTVCNGTVNEVCPVNEYLVSVTSVLCLAPLIIIIILLIIPILLKKIKKIQTKTE